MHRVGYRQDGKKSDLWEKKSKIPHNFFVTKATDLKTTFLGSPWKMDVETCVTLWYFLKQKQIFLHFFQPSLALKLEKLD